MKKRIFNSILLVSLVTLLCTTTLFLPLLYKRFSTLSQQQLADQVNMLARVVENQGIDYLNSANISKYRITWINKDGEVLFENKIQGNLENHLQRQEVQQALKDGYGQANRYSDTLLQRYYYSAVKLKDGSILRMSFSQNSLLNLLLGLVPSLLLVMILVLFLSRLLSSRVADQIVEPLNDIDLDDPLANDGYDELAPFLRRIASQQKQLRQQNSQLMQKDEELNTIISSMNEGMILLNNQGKVISINNKAREILQKEEACVGLDIIEVCRNLQFKELIDLALQGKASQSNIELNDLSYQLDADPIIIDDQIKGIVVFMFDITEKQEAEKLRREFSANVSHELKTPLQVISGYAELFKNGMVKPADQIPFACKIYNESQRLVQLVDDTISLSALDEGGKDLIYEPIDLYSLASQACDSLKQKAERLKINVNLVGEKSVIIGCRSLLYSIIYNLLDNALKYNHQGGYVHVDISQGSSKAYIKVEDNGIGISPSQQERIFERFYRVDKSHSKLVGGTGLGLSIVKHAVNIHHGKITLNSVEGKGSTFIVELPLDCCL